MEPDDIKKLWSEIDLLKEKQHVSDNRIKELLKNSGKSALTKLIRISKFYMFAMIPLGLIFCFLSYKFFEAGGYYIIYPLIFLLLCILAVPFEIYLYRLLKGIDFSTMTVKDVSEKILKYQNIIQKFKIYGMTFGIPYLGIWYYLYYKLTIGSEIVWWLIIYMICLCIAVAIGIPSLYKKLYFNNINKIKTNLEELKEFEEL